MMSLRSQAILSQQKDVEVSGLPVFPEFKPLDLRDRFIVERLTRQFPPYSDFNFVSMWSWDVYNLCRLSTLNGNLLVRFTDYISGEPFFSFIGKNQINDTIETLFDHLSKEGIPPRLRLVPEPIAHAINLRGVTHESDDGNYDYIMSIERLKDLSGQKFSSKRWLVNQFVRRFSPVLKPLDLASSMVQSELLDVFVRWAEHRGIERPDEENEYRALCRLLLTSEAFANLVALGVYVKDEMVGFVIAEDLGNGYAVGHFSKADLSVHGGIFTYLMQQHAIVLWNRGCLHLNTEQDLGSEGMRENKSSYVPLNHLRKYIIGMQHNNMERITLAPSSAMLVMGADPLEGQLSFRPPRIDTELWLNSLPPSPDDVLSQPVEAHIEPTWDDPSSREGKTGKP